MVLEKQRNLDCKKNGGSLRVDLEFLGSEARCKFLGSVSSNRDRISHINIRCQTKDPESLESLTIHEEKLAELNDSVDKSIIRCGDVNIPFSVIDWSTTLPPISKNERYQTCLPN